MPASSLDSGGAPASSASISAIRSPASHGRERARGVEVARDPFERRARAPVGDRKGGVGAGEHRHRRSIGSFVGGGQRPQRVREPLRLGARAFRDHLEQPGAVTRGGEEAAGVVGRHAALRCDQHAARGRIELGSGVAQQRAHTVDRGKVQRRRGGRAQLERLERQAGLGRQTPPGERVVRMRQQGGVDGQRLAAERRLCTDRETQCAAHVERVGERDERADVLRQRLERRRDRTAVDRLEDAVGEGRARAHLSGEADVLARRRDAADDRSPLAVAQHAASDQAGEELGGRERVVSGQPAFVDQEHAA